MTTAQRASAIAIAMYARRFCLLATTPDYRTGEEVRCAALDAEMDDPNNLVGFGDLVQIAGAGPMDTLCAEAVMKMNRPGTLPDLRQFLTLLPRDRALGIFYALGPAKRKAALRLPYWTELVAAGPGIKAVQQASWDLGDADSLGVSRLTRDVIRLVDLDDDEPG